MTDPFLTSTWWVVTPFVISGHFHIGIILGNSWTLWMITPFGFLNIMVIINIILSSSLSSYSEKSFATFSSSCQSSDNRTPLDRPSRPLTPPPVLLDPCCHLYCQLITRLRFSTGWWTKRRHQQSHSSGHLQQPCDIPSCNVMNIRLDWVSLFRACVNAVPLSFIYMYPVFMAYTEI